MEREMRGAATPFPTVVFLDRDGTIIRDTEYLSNPDDVELLPGAADAIAQINARRVPVIVVTNQSGIGRGLYTVQDYLNVEVRLGVLLAERGAHIDASYFCPHAPEAQCACRKPKAMLFRQAILDHRLDASNPLFVGDRWRDIAPMLELGGSGVILPSPSTPAGDVERAEQHGVRCMASLAEVADQWFAPLPPRSLSR